MRIVWRVAQFDPDGSLIPQQEVGYERDGSQADATTLFGRLKQHLCSDEQLAEQLQDGNAQALELLFKRHSRLIYGISRRILRNAAEAEDATQQIFLDAYRSIARYDSAKGSFKTWLLMFAYHRTFNFRRSQLARRFFDSDPLVESLIDERGSRSSRSMVESTLLANQLLRSLQPRQRRTIELVYYEGLTAEEVSVRTGESVRVVRHNLYRGLEKLRKRFSTEQNCHVQGEVGK